MKRKYNASADVKDFHVTRTLESDSELSAQWFFENLIQHDLFVSLSDIKNISVVLAPGQTEETKYRVIWWQSLIAGAIDGETLDEDLTAGEAQARLLQRQIDFRDGVGMQFAVVPMSFIPRGDQRRIDEQREKYAE